MVDRNLIPDYNLDDKSICNPSLNFQFSTYKIKITEKSKLNDSVYKLVIANKHLAKCALPGQFLHVKCSAEHILRRPISISDVIGDQLCIVLEVKGDGTRFLCERNIGETLDVIGPLGRGFSLLEGNVVLVGGGIGAAPLLYAAKSLSGRVTAILGFRKMDNVILADAFSDACDNVLVTTDDGSYGIRGTVVEPLKTLLAEPNYSAVLACGPQPMMSAVSKLCKAHGVPCQVSLEERMGCGIGACYVCACKTVVGDVERMSRVCVDGPVFDAHEVVFG